MKPLKVILVGFGNMGKEWAKIIKKVNLIQLIGVIDFIESNRNLAQIEFKLKKDQVSNNLKDMVLRLKPDAILDCSPPFAHLQNTSFALNNYCHVFGEKPISLNINDAYKLVKLSKSKELLYMVNQNYRRNPILEIIRKNLQKIGKIYNINIDYYQNLSFKDTFRYKFDHPLLLDMAIHHFDMVRFITGINAYFVFAQEFNPISSKFKNGSSIYANFRMSDKSFFSYRGSWSSWGFDTSYNGQWRIIGELGTIIWDGNLDVQLERKVNNRNLKEKIHIPFTFTPYEVFLYELEQNIRLFINSISTKTLPDCWCGDNLNTLNMVLSAIKSSELNKPIRIKSFS